MTKIYYFSGSGHSFAVANALAEMIHCEMSEICYETEIPLKEETAVVVFPVYCQNIPKPVKTFLNRLFAKHIVLIATYGKISHGNVLFEAQNIVHGDVIAGAYIPIGHTFLDGDCAFDPHFLLPITERIKNPRKAQIPKTKKHLLADIFPGFRSRISVRIKKKKRCDNCGLCVKNCPTGAMHTHRITSNCIRCLRCVTECPQNALLYKNSRILSTYLNRHHNEEYRLYL